MQPNDDDTTIIVVIHCLEDNKKKTKNSHTNSLALPYPFRHSVILPSTHSSIHPSIDSLGITINVIIIIMIILTLFTGNDQNSEWNGGHLPLAGGWRVHATTVSTMSEFIKKNNNTKTPEAVDSIRQDVGICCTVDRVATCGRWSC